VNVWFLLQRSFSNSSLIYFQVDLLPRDTDLNCVGDWVVEATTKKKLR
jgi:hypothetical protein